MSSGVGQKYAVSLAQVSTSSVVGTPVGYNVRGNGYSKQDADTFAPRFGTGAEGLSNLDTWKTWQMIDFSGGGFQDKWDDTTKFQQLRNAVLNPIDSRLYPSVKGVAATVPAGNRSNANGTVVYKNILYKITNGNGAGSGAVSKYVPATKTWTNVKNDFATAVSDMAVGNNRLWAATTGGLYWMFDGTTWSSQAGFTPTQLKVFGGRMYASDSAAGAGEGQLVYHDATGVTGAVGVIGAPGDINKPIKSFEVFNHRLYIGKTDGLYAYDGVQISTVLDYAYDEDPNNFKKLVVMDGVMYFQVKNNLFKFNGSTVEKLRSFANYETITSLDVAYGRLYIGTYQDTTLTGSGQAVGACNLYYYDGVGFFLYDGTQTGSTSLQPLGTYYLSDGTYKHLIFEINGSSGIADNQTYVYDMALEFKAGSSSVYNDLEIYTSVFDAGFPYVDKYNDSATLSYEGADTGDTLSMYWRLDTGSGMATAWSSTIGGTFRRMQVKLVLHRVLSTSNLSLTSFSLRYVLSPDMKRRWTITFLNIGTTDQPEELLDGSVETLNAKNKREQIYACRINDVPSFFEDIDTCVLGIDPGSGGTSITVDSTAAFPPSGYIKIGDELILYGAKTDTIFYNCTRGRWGTTAAAHAIGSVVGTAYRVIITKIMNERIVAPNNTDGLMDVAGNPSELTAVLQEV